MRTNEQQKSTKLATSRWSKYVAPKMRILDALQIERKLSRLAMEILEQHVEAEQIFLVGVNNNGFSTARFLREQMLRDILHFGLELEVHLRRVRLSPADPLDGDLVYEGDIAELEAAHIILVDDVANTGRTAFFAAKPMMEVLPASFEIAVLIDRLHKGFPARSDYVGMTLSTNLQEEIRVHYDDGNWRAEIF